MKLLTKLAVFGAGYVMGTKAGQERYEQIVELARRASERLDAYGAIDHDDQGPSERASVGP